MSAKTRAAFILAFLVFIIAALAKVAIDFIEIYTLIEEKSQIDRNLTALFVAVALLTITRLSSGGYIHVQWPHSVWGAEL
jgi:2-phospho-L-lactate guanylyltransferase (CobY/MobA/RfbA family)